MLQAKKDELSRLLLSRKRKLSELYYATVSPGDLNGITKTAEYLDKERSFLQANDIQKGHFFDISTLPSRFQTSGNPSQRTQTTPLQKPAIIGADFESPPGPAPSPPSPSRLPEPDTYRSPPSLPKPSEYEEEEELPRSVTDAKRTTLLDGMPNGGPDRTQSARPTPEALIPAPTITTTTGQPSNGQEAQKPDGSLKRKRSPSPSPLLSSNDYDSPRIRSHSQRVSPSKTTRVSSPQPPRSTTLVPAPQSSPASTNGAASSNTLEVAAGSPTTTPGDDHGSDAIHTVKSELPKTPMQDSAMLEGASRRSSPRPNSSNGSCQVMRAPADLCRGETNPTPKATKPSFPDVPLAVSSISRKPDVRIDTQTASINPGRSKPNSVAVESPLSLGSAFPLHQRNSSSASASASVSVAQSPSSRITRISSGTIRHRSVSEILGERPKPSLPVEPPSILTSIPTSTQEEIDSSILGNPLKGRKKRDKERRRLSTVVFPKQLHSSHSLNSTKSSRSGGGNKESATAERDYLHVLFESKAYSPPRGPTLSMLMQSAHKALSTADHLIDYQEQMHCRTLKRIYQLQNAGRWSLRQVKRVPEPTRQTTHWDFVLDHARWMRTDFQEERKWKKAAAKGVAEWCAEWMHSSLRRRKQLQVRVRPPRQSITKPHGDDVDTEDVLGKVVSPKQPTTDLVPSAEAESVADVSHDTRMNLRFSAPPAAIFSLGPSEFNFPIGKNPATEKLMNELPFYQPAQAEGGPFQSDLAEQLDARWKTDIVAVSKFATEKIHYRSSRPPTKRSRYQYELERQTSKETKALPPTQQDVALFMPENKHIRDRIHPGQSFRPPWEYPMPTQAFFESRSSSQWTQAEDEQLRKMVKAYSFNWSLISSCLATGSRYHSGADRRTPWECFERWVNLEGLPSDMSKTAYFRAYNSRMEAANRQVMLQHEAAQRQAGGNPSLTPKKRTTQPIRVERKKQQRHLAMLDAMRKLAKSRETTVQKQQHAADLAAMRKANDADRPRRSIASPAELSRLKHERDVKLAERQEMYRLQVLAHQKAALQQRTAQLSQSNPMANGVARVPLGPPTSAQPGTSAATLSNGLSGSSGTSNTTRSQTGVSGAPNGAPGNGGFGSNGIIGPKGLPHAQMQAGVGTSRNMGGSPERMRVLYEANRLQQQQQMMLAARQQQQQQQQQQQHQQQPPPLSLQGSSGQHSSTNLSGAGVVGGGNSNPSSPAFLAALAASNGISSPSMQGAHLNGIGGTGSPRLPNSHTNPTGVVPGVSQLSANLQRQNPEASPEEIQRLTHAQLSMYRQQAPHGVTQKSMNQAALNAAAGAANAGAHAANASSYSRPPGVMSSEQIQAYNLQLRQQQAAQRANGVYNGAGVGANVGMSVSGHAGGMSTAGGITGLNGSPIMNMARPVSNHNYSQGPISRSATPRDQRSSSLGGSGGGAGSNAGMSHGSPGPGQAQVSEIR